MHKLIGGKVKNAKEHKKFREKLAKLLKDHNKLMTFSTEGKVDEKIKECSELIEKCEAVMYDVTKECMDNLKPQEIRILQMILDTDRDAPDDDDDDATDKETNEEYLREGTEDRPESPNLWDKSENYGSSNTGAKSRVILSMDRAMVETLDDDIYYEIWAEYL